MSDFNLTAYNLGVRRETTVEVGARLPAEARPRLKDGDVVGVVLSSGVNDTMIDDEQQRVPTVDTLEALRRCLDFCAAAQWPVLVVGPVPIADERHNRRIGQLSDDIAALCRETGHAFVNAIDELAEDAAWRSSVAADDGAHPGADGYARLADVIWPAFRSWLAETVMDRRVSLTT